MLRPAEPPETSRPSGKSRHRTGRRRLLPESNSVTWQGLERHRRRLGPQGQEQFSPQPEMFKHFFAALGCSVVFKRLRRAPRCSTIVVSAADEVCFGSNEPRHDTGMFHRF